MSWLGRSYHSFVDSPTALIKDFSGKNPGQGTFDKLRGKHGYDWRDITNHLSLVGNVYDAYRKDKEDENGRAEAEIARNEALRQAGIENDVSGIRAQYGLFDGTAGTDPAREAVAKRAAQSMTEAHDKYKSAYLSYFNPQLDEQYQGAMTKAKWTGADRGTSGGSADQVRERPILNRYVDSRQKIAAGADAGIQGLVDQEQSSRLRLEDKARNGLAPEWDVQDELRGLGRNLDSAQNQIPREAIGDVFGAGASLYGGYQSAYGDAQGRQSGYRRPSSGLFEGNAGNSGGNYT